MTAIRPEVERGAAFLDKEEPHWWLRLDPASLDMRDCDRCVVGQVYEGIDTYYLAPKAAQMFRADYGFNLLAADAAGPRDVADWDDPRWTPLRDEWIAAAKLRAEMGGAA